jgi:cytochrome c oxidase subunit 5b
LSNFCICIFMRSMLIGFYLFMQDPYGLAIKRGPGTNDEPNLIPSAYDSRIVGCICEDESSHINWMWLYKGTQTRCSCGFWFKLVEKAPM